jgi:hypothetical protein
MTLRTALTVLAISLGLGLSACARSDAPTKGSSGSAGADAGDSGADAADSGQVEQVDASTSCSDLFTLARQQLDQAVACDLSASTSQCTALVAATCGCNVSVNSQTSNATQSYLNTLSVIQAKMCGGKCPPLYCPPPGPALCVMQSGGSTGVCVHRP